MNINNQNNTKRVAKNTVFLYARMLFLMLITLYTSRIVLDKLGVVDFGIYNIVGGLAGMFSFFSSSLANATQRFLSVELSINNTTRAQHIFNQHLYVYIFFIIVLILGAETIGLWFVNHKLNIPPDRLNAVLYVYQFMIVSLSVTLLGIVFNSMVIAHEHMKIYSYIGIFEGIAKLVVAYVLSFASFDHLIIYSFLMLMVTIITQALFATYCFRSYTECRIDFKYDNKTIKETFSFVSWNVVGTFFYMVKDQMVNILLNLFFGPAVNTARAVSFQVSSAISNFGSNFYTAVRPQIIKSYATKQYDYLRDLYFASSKYSLYLLWLFCLPTILNIDTILSLWLKEVPQESNIFTIWVLIDSMLAVLTNAPWTVTLAIGKLRKYVLYGNGTLILIYPFSYIALCLGHKAVSVFIITVAVRCLQIFAITYCVNKHIRFGLSRYFSHVIMPPLMVFAISGSISFICSCFCGQGVSQMLAVCSVSMLSSSAAIWLLGLTSGERIMLKNLVISKIGQYVKQNHQDN